MSINISDSNFTEKMLREGNNSNLSNKRNYPVNQINQKYNNNQNQFSSNNNPMNNNPNNNYNYQMQNFQGINNQMFNNNPNYNQMMNNHIRLNPNQIQMNNPHMNINMINNPHHHHYNQNDMGRQNNINNNQMNNNQMMKQGNMMPGSFQNNANQQNNINPNLNPYHIDNRNNQNIPNVNMNYSFFNHQEISVYNENATELLPRGDYTVKADETKIDKYDKKMKNCVFRASTGVKHSINIEGDKTIGFLLALYCEKNGIPVEDRDKLNFYINSQSLKLDNNQLISDVVNKAQNFEITVVQKNTILGAA